MIDIGEIKGKLTADSAGFKKGTSQARDELGRFVKTAKQADSAIGNIDKQLAKAAAGVGVFAAGVGGFAIKAAGDFQQAIATAGAKANATTEQMEAMAAAAKQAGIDSAFGAKEAADAMGLLAQAGLSVEEQITALPGLLDLASAGAVDLATATDIAIGGLKGFGLEVEEIGRVNDVLAKAANSTNTSIEELGMGLSYAAPTAAALGISIEETSAAMGLMANAGIKGSRAGTSLNGMMAQLVDVSDKLGAGLKVADIQTLGLAGTLEKLAAKGLTGRNAMELFGREAGPGVAALLSQGTEAIAELDTELQNAGGTAKEVAERQLATMNGQIKLLMGSVETLAITLGETLVPVVSEVSSTLIEQTNALTQNEDAMTKFSASVADGVRDLSAALDGIAPALTIAATTAGLLTDGLRTLDIVATTAAVGLGKLWEMVLTRLASGGNVEAIQDLEKFQRKLAASTEDLERKVDKWGKATMAGVEAGDKAVEGLRRVTDAARRGADEINRLAAEQDRLNKVAASAPVYGPTLDQAGLSAEELAKRVKDAGDKFEWAGKKGKTFAEELLEVEVAAQRAAAAVRNITDAEIMGEVEFILRPTEVYRPIDTGVGGKIGGPTPGMIGGVNGRTQGGRGGTAAGQIDSITRPLADSFLEVGSSADAMSAVIGGLTGGLGNVVTLFADMWQQSEGFTRIMERVNRLLEPFQDFIDDVAMTAFNALEPVFDLLDALAPVIKLVLTFMNPLVLPLKLIGAAVDALAPAFEWLERAIKEVIVWFANIGRRNENKAYVSDAGNIIDPLGKVSNTVAEIHTDTGGGGSGLGPGESGGGSSGGSSGREGMTLEEHLADVNAGLLDAVGGLERFMEAADKATESLTNVPVIFNANLARSRASRAGGSFSPDRSGWAGAIGDSNGMNDLATATAGGGVSYFFEGDFIVQADSPEDFSRSMQRQAFTRTGAAGASQQSNLVFPLQTAG